MNKILLAGNPNVGKSTLFNSLTKSCEHTGNFHGVTVEEKSKVVKFENESYSFIDLPGLYSLNAFSQEEEIARDMLIKDDGQVLMIVDANSIRKNFYLCQQLNEIGINYKILINNYAYFQKNKKNCNKIDLNKLKNKTNKEIYLINAKKYKINKDLLKNNKKYKNNYKYLEKYIKIVKNSYNLDEKTIVFALNGIFFNLNVEQINFVKSLFPELIKDRYAYIDEVLNDCLIVDRNYVYGKSKWDKFLLNPFIAFVVFIFTFLIGFYVIFYLIGPFISEIEEKILTTIFINPTMNFLYLITDNVWLIEFVRNGILNSIVTVIGFIPQVTLLFVFLSILEDSGIVSRFAYVFDDLLNFFGLNGKVLYVMLLGLGCNTMSTAVTKNMSEKNLKTKTAIINPYISCTARLPVYALIASTFFSKNSFFMVAGLYVLGLVVALVMSLVLNKTILKSENNELLLEFPPLRNIDIKHILQVARVNAVDFFKRIFSVILSVGIIVWILTHTEFNLKYTENISDSILFYFADKISIIFKPIGLNSAGVVCALFVGILAKELIVSTFAICNNTTSQKLLMASLMLPTSVISFTIPSAVSFLVFSLLYSPCASNLAVIKKETNKFYMWFSLISQFTIAYMLSFIVYQTLTKGIVFTMMISIVIMFIMFALNFIRKQFIKKCNGKCFRCNCNKKS